MTYYKFGKLVVTAICAFELLGLWGPKRIPSITKVVHATRQRPLGKALVAGLVSWELYHLLVEEPPRVVAIPVILESSLLDPAA